MTVLRTDDLVIPQGATWAVRWPIKNSDGLDADLTGWEVRAQVRASRGSEGVLHEWSVAGGNAEIIASLVSLNVEAPTSTAWPWTNGVYDVELFHPDGRVVRVSQGAVSVDSEVTR